MTWQKDLSRATGQNDLVLDFNSKVLESLASSSDKGDDYQLGDLACACVHNDVSDEDECVQHYVDELYCRVSSVVPDN